MRACINWWTIGLCVNIFICLSYQSKTLTYLSKPKSDKITLAKFEKAVSNPETEKDIKIMVDPDDLYAFFKPRMLKNLLNYVKLSFKHFEALEKDNVKKTEEEAEFLEEEEIEEEEEEGEGEVEDDDSVESIATRAQAKLVFNPASTDSNKKLKLMTHITETKQFQQNDAWKRIKRSSEEKDLENAIVESFTNLLETLPFKLEALNELPKSEYLIMFDYISQQVATDATELFLEGRPSTVPEEYEAGQFRFLFQFYLKDVVADVLVRATK